MRLEIRGRSKHARRSSAMIYKITMLCVHVCTCTSVFCCSSLVLSWPVFAFTCSRRNRLLKQIVCVNVVEQSWLSIALTCSRRRRQLMLVVCGSEWATLACVVTCRSVSYVNTT
jgi:hypothetical protein